jgi:8-amino-7-oxononanoate synthase
MSLHAIRQRIKKIDERIRNLVYYPYFECGDPLPGCRMAVDGEPLVCMSSNDYLGLSSDPRVIEASQNATSVYGTSRCGSRLLNGTASIHREAEERIAAFLEMESALLFTSGYQANLGLFQALLGKGDSVLLDKHCHASIYDGAILSGASLERYAHNDFSDAKTRFDHESDGHAPAALATEGIFSMDGSIPDFGGLSGLFRDAKCLIVVDEAHALGILGGGRGAAAESGILSRVDIVSGTFSKALASIGGFVAGSSEMIEYVRNCARSLIFSASPSPGAVAAAMAALDIVSSEPDRISAYRRKVTWFKEELARLGISSGDIRSPIIPLYISSTEAIFRTCIDFRSRGFMLYPIVPPASPHGICMIRIAVTDAHADEDLDRFLEVCTELKLGERLLASA